MVGAIFKEQTNPSARLGLNCVGRGGSLLSARLILLRASPLQIVTVIGTTSDASGKIFNSDLTRGKWGLSSAWVSLVSPESAKQMPLMQQIVLETLALDLSSDGNKLSVNFAGGKQ